MDIQQYIKSGILEQYVLGDLSEAERLEVAAYAQQYPAIKREIETIEGALEQLAFSSSIVPPASLENKILQRIDATDKIPNSAKPHSPKPSRQVQGGRYFKFLSFLLVACLLASLAKLYQQNTRQSALLQERNELATGLANSEKDKTDLQKDYNILLTNCIENYKTTPIGTNYNPAASFKGSAVVYQDKNNATYYLSGDLPKNVANKVYQLWALDDVDGDGNFDAPVSMGLVDFATINKGDILSVDNPSANIKGAIVGYALSEEPENEPIANRNTPDDIKIYGVLKS